MDEWEDLAYLFRVQKLLNSVRAMDIPFLGSDVLIICTEPDPKSKHLVCPSNRGFHGRHRVMPVSTYFEATAALDLME